MDFLSKVNRDDLEEMLRALMADIEEDAPELYEKYLSEAEEYMYCISIDEAKEIVSNMKPYSEKFTYESIEQVLTDKGLEPDETDIVEYYLIMNMFFNDFRPVFEKYSVLNQKEAYYDFSKCFIEDVDAPKYKVEKYFLLLK